MTTPFTPASPPHSAASNGHGPTPAVSPGYFPDGYPSPERTTRTPAPSRVGERLPRMRRPRRPALAAGGVMLVLLCGVTSAALATAGDRHVRVLTLAHDVHAGQVLS